MKKITSIRLFLVFSILIYTSEAHVSGQASFSYFEPNFEYSYSESARRKVRTEDYEKYWKDKRDHFFGVLFFEQEKFKKFAVALQEAKIPISKLELTQQDEAEPATNFESLTSHSKNGQATLLLEGTRGSTRICLQFSDVLTPLKAEQLFNLAKELEYEKLSDEWLKSKSPKAPEGAFESGVIVSHFFERLSIAVSFQRTILKTQAPEIKKAALDYLNKIESTITNTYDTFVTQKLTWVNPAHSISLEKKSKEIFKFESEQANPAKSAFNPNGPLFDDFGKRSIASKGRFVVSLLFTQDKKDSDAEDMFGKNRGLFEEWLRYALMDPNKIKSKIDNDFKTGILCAEESKCHAPESIAARERLARFTRLPHLRFVGGQDILERLLKIALKKEPSTNYQIQIAIQELRFCYAPEVKSMLMALFKEKQYVGLMGLLSQIAADLAVNPSTGHDTKSRGSPDVEIIDALIEIFKSESTLEEDRSWAKNGLQTISNKAKSENYAELASKINLILGK